MERASLQTGCRDSQKRTQAIPTVWRKYVAYRYGGSERLTVAVVVGVERCGYPEAVHDHVAPVKQVASACFEYPTKDENFGPITRGGE